MLTDKFKRRCLRPLLLLAALLALSQSVYAADYYLRGDWNGWADNQTNFDSNGKVTITYNGSDAFRLNNLVPKVHEANPKPVEMTFDATTMTTVDNNYDGDRGYNLKLVDCPSGTEVTFTVTMGSDNLPYLSASWGGGDTPDPSVDTYVAGSTIYLQLSDRWASSTTNFRAEFISGSARQQVSFTHITGNYYYCTVPAGNWTSLDLKRYDGSGNSNWSNIFAITPSEGKNMIIVDENATTDQNGVTYPEANSCSWGVYGGQEVVTGGIPFYPAGVTSEVGLKAEPAGKKYYYLVGHGINNGLASPEWQLIETAAGSGVYTLDFTFNQHSDRFNGDHCPAGNDVRNQLGLVYYTRDSENAVSVGSPVTITGLKEGWERAGVRMRATYTEGGSLECHPLRYADGAWVEADNFAEATYIPFISLVGYQWKQQSCLDAGLTIAGESVAGKTTPEQWERAWIQYGSNGQPVTSRDGKHVYYNTQWPPLNNVFINTQFEANGKPYDLLLNSRGLTFTYTGMVKTGEEWQKEFPGIKMEESYGVSAETKKKTSYVAYKVENLWANGKFKLWSGWSGARMNDNDRNGEWCMNWNWGHEAQQPYNEAAKVIGEDQTVFLGSSNGDMEFKEPTYLRTVYFFMPVDEGDEKGVANDRSRSFIYFERAIGDARIQALSREDKSGGIFWPTVDAKELEEGNWKISRIVLDLHRSATEFRVDNLWTRSDLNLDPDKFTEFFAEKFEAATYADGYWRDGFAYKTSGNYYYNMTLTFTNEAGETQSVTVRSNAFNVAVAPTSLFTAQLVKVVKGKDDPEYGKFEYVTWTAGATEEFGWLNDEAYAEKMANNYEGFDRWGHRIEKINVKPDNFGFYQDSERAEWTENVLVYARRPWMGEEPDEGLIEDGAKGAYWKIEYEGHKDYVDGKATEAATVTKYVGADAEGNPVEADSADGLGDYDGPLELMIKGTDIFRHNFTTTLYYRTDLNSELESAQPGENFVTLRIPTPRMRPGVYTGTIGYIDDVESVTIAAENHKGNVSGASFEEHTYDAPRVRHLHFKAYMDMPNATAELISVIPDTDAPATDEEKAQGIYGYSWRPTACTGDAKLLELMAGTRLNLKNMQENSTIEFIDQDITMWIEYDEDTNTFKPISRNLTFDFVRAADGNGLIQFYPRKAHGVTFEVQPTLVAPEIGEGAKAFRYLYEKDANDYYERLVLSELPVTPAKSTLTVPGESGAMEDVELNVLPEQAYYMFRIDGQLPVMNSLGSDPVASHLQHHNLITTEQGTYLVDEQHHGPYWEGIGDNSLVKQECEVEVAHAYIFRVNRAVECTGAVQPAPAAASAPRRAAEAGASYMAFVGPSATSKVGTDSIQTSIESIDSPLNGVVAGAGFIDMAGNEGSVYSVDGRLVYTGASRVNLPVGIYVVAAGSAAEKVVVK